MDRITAQTAKLGCAYPHLLTVAAMKRQGFVVDDFIPAYAVYEPRRPDHNIAHRSQVADPDYVFAWVSPFAWFEAQMRESDREVFETLSRLVQGTTDEHKRKY